MGTDLKISNNPINGVLMTHLKIIDVVDGNVLHAIKNTDAGFNGFGEAYFSTIDPGKIKGWKRHRRMTLNLIVPIGSIRFVIFNDNLDCQSVILSKENYLRLTIPPMLWMGFQGLSESTSMVLNVASIPHQPDEVDKKDLNEYEYDWSS